jgi:methionyl-tRNA synthetase
MAKVYLTTPIYYVNDRPHIGHVYTTTIADIFARYHRLAGADVFFLTGTDEHAAKVVESAAQNGLSPQAWADRNAEAFQQTFQKLGITNDDFIRTSQPRHKTKVQQYVRALLQSGDAYLGDYEGWYDAGQEEYVPENKAKDYDYKSPITGRPLVRKKEKNYFFRLSRYADRLLKLLEERPEFLRPDARRNEIVNRIREGLNDVPISRSGAGDWGIKVPGDETHVIYVWIDALFNYLSTVDTPERRAYWPATVHFIAKDILWFHAVIWPALLMALHEALPRQVYAHSFWIAEGQKMSKSLGNFVDLEKIDRYVATYGLDALRYFLASNGPLGINDSDFAEAKFAEVYTTDLANELGNLIHRTLSMIHRYRHGIVPAPATAEFRLDFRQYLNHMATLDLTSALAEVRRFVIRANRHVEERAPWALAKTPGAAPALDTVLYNLAESVRLLTVALMPVMPTAMARARTQLGVDPITAPLAEELTWGRLPPGTRLGAVTPLFPKKA